MKTIRAIYEGGVFRPLDPVDLPEGTRVRFEPRLVEQWNIAPYAPRPIRFLKLWNAENWRLKLYGIACGRPEPQPELVAGAQRVAVQQLRSLPGTLRHYHLGFLGVHEGRTSNFVFLDFWADENELHHHVFVSPTAQPDQLAYVTPSGLSACVWDLRLQAFERDAWVTHVLQRNAPPDYDGYLATTLNAEV